MTIEAMAAIAAEKMRDYVAKCRTEYDCLPSEREFEASYKAAITDALSECARENGILKAEKALLQAENTNLLKVLNRIAEQGPLERYGANTPDRCCQWIRVIRDEAVRAAMEE